MYYSGENLSIAMCTFNGEKYLGEQLESLASQSVLPLEVVICDDGSTDGTMAILQKHSQILPCRVRIYRNEKNLHFTGNFFRAASLCEGEVIAFCDQDDIWENNKIEACLRELGKTGADLLVHEGLVIDESGQAVSARIPNLSGDFLALNQPPFDQVSKGFAMLVTRDVIEEIMSRWNWHEYFELRESCGAPLGHDVFIYAWCSNTKNIVFLKSELVRYRVHGQNATANIRVTKGRLERVIAFFQGLAFDKESYLLPAEQCAADVKFLGRYIDRCSGKRNWGLEGLSTWFLLRSKALHARGTIYDKETGRIQRWRCLLALLFSGGYLSRNKVGFGPSAFFKDLVVATIL
jgi:rhamnosyltransferase